MRSLRPEQVRASRSLSRVRGRGSYRTGSGSDRVKDSMRTVEIQETNPTEVPASEIEALPFPFNQQNFCRYESIEKTIEKARVLIVDNLLRDENDLSDIARQELGRNAHSQLKLERQIASMALQNIVTNIKRLVQEPITEIAHVSELAQVPSAFRPAAIGLSGTLRDF